MSLQIKINYTTSTAEHVVVIPDATEKNDGIMTKEQVQQLNNGGDDCPCPYDVTDLKTSNYPAQPYELVRVAAVEGPWSSVVLPSAAGNKGKFVIVKNVATFFGVEITPTGGDTIDGGPNSGVLALESKTFVSDGVSNWMIIASV